MRKRDKDKVPDDFPELCANVHVYGSFYLAKDVWKWFRRQTSRRKD